MSKLKPGKQPKDNSRKTGAAARHKAQKRKDAKERNKTYQALSLEEKLKMQKKGGKVYNKLLRNKNEGK